MVTDCILQCIVRYTKNYYAYYYTNNYTYYYNLLQEIMNLLLLLNRLVNFIAIVLPIILPTYKYLDSLNLVLIGLQMWIKNFKWFIWIHRQKIWTLCSQKHESEQRNINSCKIWWHEPLFKKHTFFKHTKWICINYKYLLNLLTCFLTNSVGFVATDSVQVDSPWMMIWLSDYAYISD